jgi:hypothetical protein
MSRRDVRGSSLAAVLIAFILVAALALSACGSAEPDPSTANPNSARPGARNTGRPDMVAAVSSSRTPGAVDLRFALSGRPTVGQPLDIQLALTPTVELDLLFVRFQASEGLDLVKGAETEHFDRPARGAGLTHSVTVIPKSDGIFNLMATVLTDSPKESITRIYTIPIIAGSGLPELPPAAPPQARPQSRPARP